MQELTLLYTDAAIAVVIKPSGYLSEEHEALPSVPRALETQLGGRFFPVHRLDRETGGVMVYARTPAAAAALSSAFASHTTEKCYYAVTERALPSPDGELRDLLFFDRTRKKSYVVKRPRTGVREAVLFYEEAARRDGRILYRIRLGTGRTHQIRVQLSFRGCPLVGDSRYGGARGLPLSLFAFSLSFPHPTHGGRLNFTASPPDLHEVFLPFFEKEGK